MILLALLLAVACPHPHRDKAVIAKFKKAHQCPKSCATYRRVGNKFVLYQRCGACAADHKCALACGGPDSVDNLQWLSNEENRKKSDDCALCAGLELKCSTAAP